VRVLLADDEPLQRLLLMRPLEPLGVEVSEARNGREALDLFAEKPYHKKSFRSLPSRKSTRLAKRLSERPRL
jgi:CheY-like chemotaxis protein